MAFQPTRQKSRPRRLLALLAIAPLSWMFAIAQDPARPTVTESGAVATKTIAICAGYRPGRAGGILHRSFERGAGQRKGIRQGRAKAVEERRAYAGGDRAGVGQARRAEQAASRPLLPAVRRLAEVIGDYGPAGAALAEVKRAAASGAPPAAEISLATGRFARHADATGADRQQLAAARPGAQSFQAAAETNGRPGGHAWRPSPRRRLRSFGTPTTPQPTSGGRCAATCGDAAGQDQLCRPRAAIPRGAQAGAKTFGSKL